MKRYLVEYDYREYGSRRKNHSGYYTVAETAKAAARRFKRSGVEVTITEVFEVAPPMGADESSLKRTGSSLKVAYPDTGMLSLNQLKSIIMKEVNVFALFNTLNTRGEVRLSDCETDKVGTGMDAIAAEEAKEDDA